MNGLHSEHETDEVSEVKLIRIKCDSLKPVFVEWKYFIVSLSLSLCIVCRDIHGAVSTHATEGYLSIFIMKNERKHERKDERKR